MKYVIKAISNNDYGESFLIKDDNGQTELYDTETEAGTAMGIYEITDADELENYILVVEPEPCARRDRVTPVMGSVYCGCSECDPMDDEEEEEI